MLPLQVSNTNNSDPRRGQGSQNPHSETIVSATEQQALEGMKASMYRIVTLMEEYRNDPFMDIQRVINASNTHTIEFRQYLEAIKDPTKIENALDVEMEICNNVVGWDESIDNYIGVIRDTTSRIEYDAKEKKKSVRDEQFLIDLLMLEDDKIKEGADEKKVLNPIREIITDYCDRHFSSGSIEYVDESGNYRYISIMALKSSVIPLPINDAVLLDSLEVISDALDSKMSEIDKEVLVKQEGNTRLNSIWYEQIHFLIRKHSTEQEINEPSNRHITKEHTTKQLDPRQAPIQDPYTRNSNQTNVTKPRPGSTMPGTGKLSTSAGAS